MTQSSTSDTTPATTQDFLAFLASIKRGGTARELGEKLQELVAAVEETGKAGTLSLKIGVKPAGKSIQDGAVMVTDEIALKAPRLARPESIFFSDADHNLVRSNPHQHEFEY